MILLGLFFYYSNGQAITNTFRNVGDISIIVSVQAVMTSWIGSVIMWFIAKQSPVRFSWLSLIVGEISVLTVMIYSFSFGGVYNAFGIVSLIAFVFLSVYLFLVRKKIQYAASIIKIAMELVVAHPQMTPLSLITVVSQGVWTILFIGFVISSFSGIKNATNSPFLAFFLTVVFFNLFYWTFNLISNILFMITSGIVAEWYFKAPERIPNITFRSMKRTFSGSFGSLSKGSFIIPWSVIARFFLKILKDSDSPVISVIGGCIFFTLNFFSKNFENSLSEQTYYSLTFISIYGTPYSDSATTSWDILQSRGFGKLC
jgi:hypothetical protein